MQTGLRETNPFEGEQPARASISTRTSLGTSSIGTQTTHISPLPTRVRMPDNSSMLSELDTVGIELAHVEHGYMQSAWHWGEGVVAGVRLLADVGHVGVGHSGESFVSRLTDICTFLQGGKASQRRQELEMYGRAAYYTGHPFGVNPQALSAGERADYAFGGVDVQARTGAAYFGAGLLPVSDVVFPALAYGSKALLNVPAVGRGIDAVADGTKSLLDRFGLFGRDDELANSRNIAAIHVREARNILRDAGLNPARRNRILRSFNLETFRVEHVTSSKQIYRVFDDSEARMEGRYTSPMLPDNQTERIVKFALPNSSATRLAMVDVPEGATIFTGEVSPQLTFSPGLIGGGQQIFLTGPLEQYAFEEMLMPRELLDIRSVTYGY